eukprot:CAMPEP_0204347320 /NCGR_PEP_ID=MMETSP0469-20131031/27860_1 /ASSEMBLY_ACC=CAM_ASM_000384 /TAXON_ID=2969 /ORGANISM="Oxyrrhis marina" /LENGTH=60 /DNA_ID=CAMNT_0051333109 /DNA_START=18 /DNA_END=200 /DNA_ORIENTATION=-
MEKVRHRTFASPGKPRGTTAGLVLRDTEDSGLCPGSQQSLRWPPSRQAKQHMPRPEKTVS